VVQLVPHRPLRELLLPDGRPFAHQLAHEASHRLSLQINIFMAKAKKFWPRPKLLTHTKNVLTRAKKFWPTLKVLSKKFWPKPRDLTYAKKYWLHQKFDTRQKDLTQLWPMAAKTFLAPLKCFTYAKKFWPMYKRGIIWFVYKRFREYFTEISFDLRQKFWPAAKLLPKLCQIFITYLKHFDQEILI
jgi:hypothetical protein